MEIKNIGPIAPAVFDRRTERHENRKHVKIGSRPPGAYVPALARLLSGKRKIFVGNAGSQRIEGFARGAAGGLPGPFMPDIYRAIWEAFCSGNGTEAQRIPSVLNAVLNHIRRNVEMIVFSEQRILKRRGWIRCDFCRAPALRTEPVYDSIFEHLYQDLSREFREAGHGSL